MATITLPAHIDSLTQGIAFVVDCAAAEGFPLERLTKIELAVEEALANICQYAYLDDAGEVEIRCTRDETQRFLIEFIDAGKPFNILTLPAPDLTADLEHRQVGGLGVSLIHAMVDKVNYRRQGDRNILQLVAQLPL
jgi:anti-sigma regulatory factor (Ser/Thr protein kinase)